MLPSQQTYETLCRDFRWPVPEYFNMGVEVCDRWAADPTRMALIFQGPTGAVEHYSFARMKALSGRMSHLLRARGVAAGDRVAILLPQTPETAFTHLATYRMGAIAVPLFVLFGVDALQFRLQDSAARVLVTDARGAAKVAQIRDTLPELQTVLCIDGDAGGSENLGEALRGLPEHFEAVRTRADDPALIIYTSGTTGKPKGALQAHRTLLGHMPGVEMSHNLLGQPGDLLWTPADWAWIGGLLDVLMPAWYLGLPVLAHRFEKFHEEAAFELMARHAVRNAFLPPTALKMMRSVEEPRRRWPLRLRSVASGGEPLGAQMLAWGQQAFGLNINEFYGQTECNMTVSSCAALFEPRAGSMGRAAVGHRVAVIDEQGEVVPAGEMGQIAVWRPDPVMFLGYWNQPEATAQKYLGPWLVTGDSGSCDADGYLRFLGRDDDVITSAGYRIGPGPIEDCLLRHPAVRLAAVVGCPDEQRTEAVKAYLVLREGFAPSDALTREIQDLVRTRLAAHEYPRQVRYVPDLPLTSTGKIIRRELRSRRD